MATGLVGCCWRQNRRRRRWLSDSPTAAAGGSVIRLNYVASNQLLHSYHCAGLRMDCQGSDLKSFIHINGRQVLQRVDNNYTLRYFTENEICHITNGYSTMLGQGAFGQVFKGTLDDQSTVAVKRYKHETRKEEFAREVIVHSQINHRNVVKLLGCCIEESALMIVMEFISNGNLDSILHCSNSDGRVPFPLDKRLDIAIEVAEALWCMHSMYSPVLHGDVKPANILLNERLAPKVSDFGIARLLCADDAQHTKNIIGSIGYLDPAFCETGILTPKSDVYSFGVVLLELITRQKAVNGTIVLAQSFTEAYEKGKKIMFDAEINGTKNIKFLGDIGKLATKCLRRDVKMRPEIVEVIISLRLIRKAMQGEQVNLSQQYNSAPKSSISIQEVGSGSHQFGNLSIFTKEEMKTMTRNYSMPFREEFRERQYSGFLPNGHPVIVKQLKTRSQTEREIFLKTMSILSQKNHKNVMNVVGFYLGKSISDCIYGSFCDLSQSNDGSVPLSYRSLYETICSRKEVPLLVRLSIAVQCAEGLVHIHSLLTQNPESSDTGLSGNFKSTNIFLDNNFVAKVFNPNLSTFLGLSVMQRYTFLAFSFDHGLAKYYSDPRSVSGQLFDPKSDVYSFGAVLLELITWTTVRYMSDGRAQVLTKDFLDAYRKNCNTWNSFGKRIYDEQVSFLVHEAIAIADECLQLDRVGRPEMSVVLSRLRIINSKLADLLTISLDELKERTLNFSDEVLIGEGPNAAVFLGVLEDGHKSAVKKLTPKNEISVQSSSGMSKHDNVVQLLGHFVEKETHVLVYDYAPRGSLYDILHGKKGVKGDQPGPPLSWLQRVKIAISAAKGLEFLHDKANPRVIHTNIKSSNILLFDDDVAKIGDLGITVELGRPRLVVDEVDPPYVHVSSNVGYGAPECTRTGQYSIQSDVYSFGVVLLELLTGREAVDPTQPFLEQYLVMWTRWRLTEDRVKQCIDPRLGAYPRKAAAMMAVVAEMCVQYEAKLRPSMSTVVKFLSPLLKSSTPSNPCSIGEAPGV
ncbi:hypothetical protein ACP4OV_016501 [Aristida adscensionis]